MSRRSGGERAAGGCARGNGASRDCRKQHHEAPVLFVDVDGVLNVAAGDDGAFSPLHGSLVDRLARAVRRGGARVVLSSSWRHDCQRLVLLRRAWQRAGLPPLDHETPTLATGRDGAATQRVLEIREWLRAEAARRGHGGSRWVAVDDLDLAAAAASLELETAERHFVRTDPTRGLTADDVETLVERLGGEQEGDSGAEAPAAQASLPAQLLQTSLDLLVITSDASDAAVVVDTSAFSGLATLHSVDESLRGWLMGQEADYSFDRIAGVHLHAGAGDEEEKAGEEDAQPFVTIRHAVDRSLLSPTDFADELAKATRRATGDFVSAADCALALVLKAIHERDLDAFSPTAVSTAFRAVGLSSQSIATLIKDPPLANRLVDLLPLLKPASPLRVALAVEICQRLADPADQPLRRLLAEYVARNELNSRGAVEAVQLTRGTTFEASIDLEELDALLASY